MNKGIVLVVLIKSILFIPSWGFTQIIDPMYGDVDESSMQLSLKLPTDTSYKYLKKINNQVIFEKTFVLDSLKSETIEDLLTSSFPGISDVSSFQKSIKIISFDLKNVYVDYKKYGLKKMTMNPILAFPMSCNVSVIWKDGRYRITASNISFNVVSFGVQKLTDHILSDELRFDDKKIVTSMGHCLENFFSDKFNVDLVNSKW